MKLGIVKEIRPDERRVALSPQTVARLIKAGWTIVVETDAGARASFPDSLYAAAGATVAATAEAVWAEADVVCKVRPPGERADGSHEADLARAGQVIIAFVYPAQQPELVQRLAARKATVLAMDCIPRISRAQKVDALSSMANIAGYRAVVEAAQKFGSFFTGQITAAGKVPPAKVLVIGAGVAGLAALGAAKGMGAIVRAFDVRPAVAEQVQSMGAEFLTVEIQESGEGAGGYAKEMSQEFIDAEMALFRKQAAEVNIVITTALIPGRPAPKLWLADMVEAMKPGSVVVDLAAEAGGNCDLTRPGEAIEHHGVTIIGYTDLPSRMANVASELYGTNIWHLLGELGGVDKWQVDHGNDIIRGALVLDGGEVTWPPPKPAAPPTPVAAPPPPPAPTPPAKAAPAKGHGHGHAPGKPVPTPVLLGLLGAFAAAFLGLRFGLASSHVSPQTGELLQHLTVFVLAVFVGWQVVWNVTPALHTPLMSVTNAVSGIIVVGGLLGAGEGTLDTASAVAIAAVLFATINIAGGFWVTRRMLAMFRK
ncbi:MAG: Re/Si-specific NAD(P)(+) transhydrogenase subunit alpha [Kofleriaceae bacterium]